MSQRSNTTHPRSKPLKRPTQERAKVTVQAIFDTYVRIWQRDGWERITTRALALEAGVAVGTFYDYFPSKQALHSAYVRRCIENLLEVVEQRVVTPAQLSWQQRLELLIGLLSGVEREELLWFHPDMMKLEPQVAEPKYQQRSYAEMLAMWGRVFAACTDLPRPPEPALLETLHLLVWGGRRYAMQLRLDDAHMRQWAQEVTQLCIARLETQVF